MARATSSSPSGDAGREGLDLIPRIKKIRPELRIIVMSAQNTLLTAVKATERGAFEYLPKPFDLRELVNVVERALTAPNALVAAPGEAQALYAEREDDHLPTHGILQGACRHAGAGGGNA